MTYKKKSIYFLETMIGTRYTGIESAAFKRANLFVKYGIDVTLITVGHSVHIDNIILGHQESGILDKRVTHINLFSYFQNQGNKPIEGIKVTKVSKKIKNFSYKDEVISTVSYKENKKDNIKYPKSYLYRNGNIFLDELGDHLIYYNLDGSVNRIFDSMDDLIIYFLNKLTETDNDPVFILDKNKIYTKAIFNNLSLNGKLVSMIHSTYFSNTQNIHTGRLNINYKDIIEKHAAVDRIVTLTDQQRIDLCHRFPYLNTKVTTIPHNTDIITKEFVVSDKSKPLSITIISRLSPEKRLQDAIEVINKLVENDVNVVLNIHGSGGEEKMLRDLIEKYNLKNFVSLHGFTHNITDVYRNSDLSLFMGVAEGFCLSILESLSHSCPVISNNIKYGPSDMISDGINGFLIESGNIDEFVKAITYLEKNRHDLKTMKKNAYKQVKRFSEKNVMKSWIRLLEGL